MSDPIPDPGPHRTILYGHHANRTRGTRRRDEPKPAFTRDNFELWDFTLAPTATPPEHKKGGYAREALIRGLKLQSEGNGNPFT